MRDREPVLLAEDFHGSQRVRVVYVRPGDHLIIEQQRTAAGVVLPEVREWLCTNGERSQGTMHPLTGLPGMRVFREVLPPPPPEPSECPTFDELDVKVSLQ